jgi:hypothetical protein
MAQDVSMFGKTFDRNTSDFWLGMFCGHLSLTRHGNHRGISFVFTGLVDRAEIGDKTQLLAFILAAPFKRPLAINFGIPAATVINHDCVVALAGVKPHSHDHNYAKLKYERTYFSDVHHRHSHPSQLASRFNFFTESATANDIKSWRRMKTIRAK